MPAPLAKGPSHGTATPPHVHAQARQRRPNNPLATGLIIAASVIVAAGIAIYESPQVRQWVDQSRRKIAVALHSLSDDTQPRRPSESSDDFDARRRRDHLVRRNRNELIRKARDEGVAVDLDELAKIGSENSEMAERRSRSDRTKSFDDLVGSDGMLRATGQDSRSNGQLRMRGPAGFAAGSAAAAATSNPFSDDNVLFDIGGDDDEAPSPEPFAYVENKTCESSTTIKAEPASPVAPPSDVGPGLSSESSAVVSGPCMNPTDLEAVPTHTSPLPGPLIDLAPESHPETQQATPAAAPHSEVAEDAETDADADADAAAQSFYSFTSSTSQPQDLAETQFFDNHADHLSTGTLTPPSHRSNSSVHSVVDIHHAHDMAVLSIQNDMDHDARSDVFSDAGWTDAAVSDAGDRTGVMTPNSWTDIGSDDGSEWGGQGHVSQVHQ